MDPAQILDPASHGVTRTDSFCDQLTATVSVSPGTHQVTVLGVDLYDSLIFVSEP